MKYVKTAAAWFAVSFLGVLVAQFADVQKAVDAGDWDAAKKVALAALAGAVTAGIGSVLTHTKGVPVGDPAPPA